MVKTYSKTNPSMQRKLTTLGVFAILGATLALGGFVLQDVTAANSANKSSFQSATMEVVLADANMNEDGAGSLAYASMKASNPQDVLILYDEECSLMTEVKLKGPKDGGSDGIETDEVQAAHRITLEIDGVPYGSEITMCDRTYGMSTNLLSEVEELCDYVANLENVTSTEELSCDPLFLDSWINTKASHGWHWVIANVGEFEDANNDGLITFEVVGSVDVDDGKYASNTGVAVGQRALSVVPIHLDVDA
jgi:hypothetical protein